MDSQSFRDYCAAMAMQGLVGSTGQMWRDKGAAAVIAFDIADAMAAEREKRNREAELTRGR